jgi:hypothetical protein
MLTLVAVSGVEDPNTVLPIDLSDFYDTSAAVAALAGEILGLAESPFRNFVRGCKAFAA